MLLISLFLRLFGFAVNVIFFLVFQLYILTSFYYVKSEIHGLFCYRFLINILYVYMSIQLADADRLQVVPIDEDEENQCIRLLSFCKRHSPNPSIERVAPDERMGQLPSQQSDYVNPSGCARTGMSFISVFLYCDNR